MDTNFTAYFFKKATDGQLTEEEVRKVVETWNNKNTKKFIGIGTAGFVLQDQDGFFRIHPNQILMVCSNCVDGFRTFYTEENIQKILDYMGSHECYGIIGTIEMSDELHEAYKEAQGKIDCLMFNC